MLTLLKRTIFLWRAARQALMRELIIADNVHGESGLDPALPEPLLHPKLHRRGTDGEGAA
jgi:pyrimidine-specific ribonucleoside hydrolase